MDKNKLIAVLAYKLESSGVKRETAIDEAKTFVASLSDEDAAKLIPLIGNDAVMSQIALSLKKRSETSTSLAPVPVKAAANQTPQAKPTAPKTASPQAVPQERTNTRPKPAQGSAPARQNQHQDPAARAAVIPSTVRNQNQPQQNQGHTAPREMRKNPNAAPNGAVNGAQIRGDMGVKRDGQIQQRQPRQPQQETPAREQRYEQQRMQNPVQRAAAAKQNSAANKSRVRKDEVKDDKRIIYRPDPNADYRKFYIILACTSPIWLFLALAGITAFLFVLGGMCLSIVLLILALIAGVAAGTVLSLVGIIYGITQLFKYAPIGLYEIGLGLMIGGITMLAGIVVYNVAVRLLPFLIKKVFALLVFTMHKCVELYFYVKGACADL